MVPSNADNVEFVKYWFDQAGKEEIKDRFEKLAYQEQENEGLEASIEKRFESAMDQSEVRRGAIEQILEFCKDEAGTRSKPLAEFIKRIETLVEDSYVEL